MAEPDWMPSYRIEFWEGGFRNRLLDTLAAKSAREVDAIAEAKTLLEDAWKPGPRIGRRARPLTAIVSRRINGQDEDVAHLTWTIDGVR